MIRVVNDVDEVIEFTWELSRNNLQASYPRLNSKFDVKNEIEKSIIKENFNTIAFYNKNKLFGVCSYFWIEDERYAQTTIFIIDDGYKNIADEFINYLGRELRGYELFIGVPNTNKYAIEYFKEKGVKCVENSIVTKKDGLSKNLNLRCEFIEKIDKTNFIDYSLFHDRYAISNDIYYNSENVYKEIENFRIYVYTKDKEIYGSIFVKIGKKISEVIGLFIDKRYRNKGIEYILLNEMLAELYNEFGTVKEILYFIDKDSIDEMDIALQAGFEIVEEYKLYKYNL